MKAKNAPSAAVATAELLDYDGRRFTTTDGTTLAELAMRSNATVEGERHVRGGRVAYRFRDGSGLIEQVGLCWDLALSPRCLCMDNEGHRDDCGEQS